MLAGKSYTIQQNQRPMILMKKEKDLIINKSNVINDFF